MIERKEEKADTTTDTSINMMKEMTITMSMFCTITSSSDRFVVSGCDGLVEFEAES